MENSNILSKSTTDKFSRKKPVVDIDSSDADEQVVVSQKKRFAFLQDEEEEDDVKPSGEASSEGSLKAGIELISVDSSTGVVLMAFEDNRFEGMDVASRSASLIKSVNDSIIQGECWDVTFTVAQLDKLMSAYRSLIGATPSTIVSVEPKDAFRYVAACENPSLKWNEDPYYFTFNCCDPSIEDGRLKFVHALTRKPIEYEFVGNSPLNIAVKSAGVPMIVKLNLDNAQLYNIAAGFYKKRSETSVDCSFGTIQFSFGKSLMPVNGTLNYATYHSIARSIASLSKKLQDTAFKKLMVKVVITTKSGPQLKADCSYYDLVTDLIAILQLNKDVKATVDDGLKIRRWVRKYTILDKGFCKDVKLQVKNSIIQQSVAQKHWKIATEVLSYCFDGTGHRVIDTVGYVGVMIESKKKPKPANLGVAQFLAVAKEKGIAVALYDYRAKPDGTRVSIQGEDYTVLHADINSTVFSEEILITDCNYIGKGERGMSTPQCLNQQSLRLVAARKKLGMLTVVKLFRDSSLTFGVNQSVKIIAEGRLHNGEVFGMTCKKTEASLLCWDDKNVEADAKRGIKIDVEIGGDATLGRCFVQAKSQLMENEVEDFVFDPSKVIRPKADRPSMDGTADQAPSSI